MCTDEKKIVMLHYSQYGVLRSPNIEFDMLRDTNELRDRYEFVTLDQAYLPSEYGHIKSILMLKKLIAEVNPDIVHISGVKEGFHCVIAAVLAGCKNRILITHGFAGLVGGLNPIDHFIFKWIVEPITLLLSTHVQCNSTFSYEQLMLRLFAKDKCTVIYNFLNVPIVSAEHVWRKRNNIPENVFLVVTIGNMHSGKGYDVLEEAIKRLVSSNNVRFVVIGNGVLKEEFDRHLDDYIQAQKVYSLGMVQHDEAMQILSESNLFFLPTRFETLGMVFAEAGYYGIPAIGTRVGAIGEIVLDGKTGYLIDPNDVDAAVEKIKMLMQDVETYNKMRSAAEKHVRAMFSRREIAKQIAELYDMNDGLRQLAYKEK